jgi:hypothetical protein
VYSTILEDYLWLKRGLLDEQIHGMFADKGNLKGIVMFGDTDDYAYVVDAAQPKGRTPAQRDEWKQPGLLLYRVELRSGSGQIVPVVSEWGTSDQGGAPLAPYLVPAASERVKPVVGSVSLVADRFQETSDTDQRSLLLWQRRGKEMTELGFDTLALPVI